MTISTRASIIVLIVPLFVATPALAAYFVDNAGTGCSNGSTTYDPAARNCSGGSDTVYTSWNAANAVPAGSTINVRSGNYYEKINITTANTTWQRYPSDYSKPIIDGEYSRPGVAEATLVAIGNESAGKTTDNISVYGNLVANHEEGIAINNIYSGSTPTNVYIYNNTVINPKSSGSVIKIQDGKANSSQHIRNNIFWQPGGTIAAVGPDAVNVDWGYNLWGSAPSTVVGRSTDPTHAAGYPTLDIADYFQTTTGWDSVATGSLTGKEFALRATAQYAIDTGVDLGPPYASLLDLAGVDFVARNFPRLVNTAPCDLGAGPAAVAGRCSKDSDCADGDPCTSDSCDISSHTCSHQRLGGCGDGTLGVFDRGAGDRRPGLVDAGAARDFAGGRLVTGCSCSYGATPAGSVVIWVLLFGAAGLGRAVCRRAHPRGSR